MAETQVDIEKTLSASEIEGLRIGAGVLKKIGNLWERATPGEKLIVVPAVLWVFTLITQKPEAFLAAAGTTVLTLPAAKLVDQATGNEDE